MGENRAKSPAKAHETKRRATGRKKARMSKAKDKIYTIRIEGQFLAVIERATGRIVAEYDGQRKEGLAKSIDAHLSDGGTLGNYQW